ncbi:MAG TPA: hypothetical protein VK610_04500 [Rhodothermales bacterium]|nr:hypothetical protein [Rhodothermales bacterium]
MHPASFLAVVAVAYAGGVAPARAQGEGAPGLEEAALSDLARLQERGALQLTLTPAWSALSPSGAPGMGAAAEYGVTDWWQVGAEAAVAWGEDGGRALALGTRVGGRLPGGADAGAALGVEVEVEAGGGVTLEPSLAAEAALPRWAGPFRAFAEAGATFVLAAGPGEPSDPLPDDGTLPGWALGGGLVASLGAAHLLLETRWEGGGFGVEGAVAPGLAWSLPGGWEGGVSVPVGVHGPEAGVASLVIHLTYELELVR